MIDNVVVSMSAYLDQNRSERSQ